MRSEGFSLQLLGVLLALYASARSFAAESCDPIVTFADDKPPLREVFISPTGNNTTGDGSQGNPWQTISRALQGVLPGDAIRMLPGMYPGGTFISNVSGTSNAPIRLGGVPGQSRPLINGSAEGLHLTKVRYFIVENLEVANATGNGINCDDGGEYANSNATRHVLFRNLHIRDIGTGGNNDGLKLSGVYDYFVLDCVFERMSAGGSGIDHVGCHRGVIARCEFTDAGSNSIQCKGGSEDIVIRACRFTNGGARAINIGGSTGFTFFRPPLSTNAPNAEARNIRVIANLFQGSDAPIAFVGTVDSLVANNTIVRPQNWILRILQETTTSGGYTFLPCGSNRFINNLVYFDRSDLSTYLNIGANTDAASFTFANNLWYAFNQPSQSQPTLPSAETNGIYGANPLFVNEPAGNFALATNSPAAGSGKKLCAARADLLEKCYANPPSIGAFEANPPPVNQADSDGDLMPDVWEDANGLDRCDPDDAALDSDEDGLSNAGEFLAGTDPNDPQSVFALRSTEVAGGNISFRYLTVTGRLYRVESRALEMAALWSESAVTNGTGGEVEYQQPVETEEGKLFRVQVELAQ